MSTLIIHINFKICHLLAENSFFQSHAAPPTQISGDTTAFFLYLVHCLTPLQTDFNFNFPLHRTLAISSCKTQTTNNGYAFFFPFFDISMHVLRHLLLTDALMCFCELANICYYSHQEEGKSPHWHKMPSVQGRIKRVLPKRSYPATSI